MPENPFCKNKLRKIEHIFSNLLEFPEKYFKNFNFKWGALKSREIPNAFRYLLETFIKKLKNGLDRSGNGMKIRENFRENPL